MVERRGGKRSGAGRPKHIPPLKEITVSLTDAQIKLLRMWGRGCVSEGLRWLINTASPLILHPERETGPVVDLEAETDHLHNNG